MVVKGQRVPRAPGLEGFRGLLRLKDINGPRTSEFQGSLLSKQFLAYKYMLCSYASTSTLSVPSSPTPGALRLSSGREVPILVVGPAPYLGLRVNASLNATPTEYAHSTR